LAIAAAAPWYYFNQLDAAFDKNTGNVQTHRMVKAHEFLMVKAQHTHYSIIHSNPTGSTELLREEVRQH
jgi:hypothetical protein